jgi:hypothetical protein
VPRDDAGVEPIAVTRRSLLRHRFVRQGLANEPDSLASVTDVEVLDAGVQDTGPDGSAWALAIRGAPTSERDTWFDDLFLAWTLRGAPHAYRRTDLDAIAVATAPFSEADAAKRIFDASRPLRAAGLDILDALRTVAGAQRELVEAPTVKGDVSGALNDLLDEPFLRHCRPCDAIHLYEQPFRLAALQAGLVLEPGTSPPVLHRVAGFDGPAYGSPGSDAEPRVDVLRGLLRFAPGLAIKDATAVIDGASADVKAHWPDDVVTVTVGDDPGKAERFALADDADWLADDAGPDERTVRLVGPFDPYLQLRDRELLVPDEANRKDLWRILGRPGAIVADGELIGSWRPKAQGKAFSVELRLWSKTTKADRSRIDGEAERLATFRGKTLKAVTEAD